MGSRDEDKADASVWAVTCLFTRAGFRKRGVSRALLGSGAEQVLRLAPVPVLTVRTPEPALPR